MKHVALLVVALGLVTGCKKKEKVEDKPMVASGSTMAGSGSDTSMAGSGSADSGSGSGSDSDRAPGQYKMTKQEDPRTPFARFDDALAGKTPWITDDEAKAGIVELIAVSDPTGKTKGTFTTKRQCGAAAKKSAETIGAAFVTRSKNPKLEPLECGDLSDTKEKTTCILMDSEVLLSAEYKKVGEAWTLVGMRWKTLGIVDDVTEKQDTDFEKLLGDKCK